LTGAEELGGTCILRGLSVRARRRALRRIRRDRRRGTARQAAARRLKCRGPLPISLPACGC